jgi:hypothetical protein
MLLSVVGDQIVEERLERLHEREPSSGVHRLDQVIDEGSTVPHFKLVILI